MSYISSAKPHLLMLLIYLRLLDLTTTALAVRSGLTELNPIFHIRGIEGLIEANAMLFLPLGVLYIASHYWRKRMPYIDSLIVGLLVAFILFSLYVVVWNNLRVIASV